MSILFGQTMRELRKARGETLVQVSSKTGLSVAMVSRIERGDRLPSARTVVALGKHFGFDPDDFLSDILAHKMTAHFGDSGLRAAAERMARTNGGSGRGSKTTSQPDPECDPDAALDAAIHGIQTALRAQAAIARTQDTERKLRMIVGVHALCKPALDFLADVSHTDEDDSVRQLARHALQGLRSTP